MKTKRVMIISLLISVQLVLSSTNILAAAGDIVFKVDIGYSSQCVPAIGNDGIVYISGTYYDESKSDYEYFMHAINPDGTLKWKFKTIESSYSPSFAADGTIYFGSMDSQLYAVNLDGTIKWKYRIRGGMFHSTPSIDDDGTIYCGSTLGTLHAVNPDGTQKWIYDTDGTIWSSPSIGHDGTIYFQSITSLSTMATSDFIYAVNPDGTLKWSFEIPSVGCESCGGGSSSPVIGIDGTIYCGTKYAYIYALNPDGILKWSLESKGGSSQSDTTIGSDGTIYYNHSHGTLAINPDGTSKWLNYVIDGKIVFDVLSYLEAATVDTVYDDEGNFKGRVVEINRFEGSPLIDSEGTIYVADLVWPVVDSPREQFNGYLYVFNPDGTQKWVVPIGCGALASSPIMDSNGIIYVSTFHGFLWAIDSGTNAGPADSPWPMHGGNQFNTGKVSDEKGMLSVEAEKPASYALLANYPNPFNPSTTIEFSIPESGFVSLVVYDITGQKIRELVSGDITPGMHSVFWDGCDENGTVVSSGVYISKLRMGNNIESHRMMLVK